MMDKSKFAGVSSGRRRAAEPVKLKKRRFTESLVFTLGIAFVAVYFAGLLAASGERAQPTPEDVAVFAVSDDAEREYGLWDRFDECLREAFSGR